MCSQPATIDLLEKFMENNGAQKRWITVQEIRKYFHMSRYSAPAIAGLLHRLHKNPTFTCSCRVTRIEVQKERSAPY